MEPAPGASEWYDEFAIGWNEIFDPDPGEKPLAYASSMPRPPDGQVRPAAAPAAPSSAVGSPRSRFTRMGTSILVTAGQLEGNRGASIMTTGPPPGEERRAYWAIARHKESTANIPSVASLKRLATLHEIMGTGESKEDSGSGNASGSASGSASQAPSQTAGSASGSRPWPSRNEATTDSKNAAPATTPRAAPSAPPRAPPGRAAPPAPPGGSPRGAAQGRRPPLQDGRHAFWASEVLTSKKPPPYLRLDGGGAKESAIDLGIKEHLLQWPVSQLRKPAEVMEVELKQLRNELVVEHNAKRKESRRRRRLGRKCRVKQHEDLASLEAQYKGREHLEVLPDPADKSDGPKSATSKDFFGELGRRRYTQAVSGQRTQDAQRNQVRSSSQASQHSKGARTPGGASISAREPARSSSGSPQRTTSKRESFARVGGPSAVPLTAR
mmetsp:Transcript_72520/g.137035  ORF Transcript_72520/g.137035 Transcript_72520/m.137035 type:complete len:440 (+) Transcript_72520:94-1413(+)